MALLPILEFPDPRLKTVAQPVVQFTDDHRELIRNMAETMYAAPGIGLAATQVDHHEQIIVIDVSESRDQLLVLINPEILAREGEVVGEEGCLSVPDYYDEVKRAERVTVRTLTESGETRTFDADGLLAICIQHEIDHLKGTLFVDHLSRLKRSRLLAKMKKRAKERM